MVGVRGSIIEGERQRAGCSRLGRDLRQAIQIVVMFAGRHARRRVLSEDNLVYQRRVGKVSVRCGIWGAACVVGHRLQTRGVVVKSVSL